MSALSDALENSLNDHLLRNTAYTPIGTLHVGLFSADPGESGVAGELTGGGYARVAVSNVIANFPQCEITGTPTKTNATTITFPTATAAWGTATHWAIYDSAVGGTNVMLVHGALTTSRTIYTGDTPKFSANTVQITMTNGFSGGLTGFAQRKLLDLVFGAIAYTPPPIVYAAVGTALTGESFTAWSDSGYTRQAATFGASSGGVTANTNILTLNASVVSNTGPLSHFGIYDDSGLGNALILGPLSTARSVPIGDSAKFPAGAITVTFS